MEIFSAIPSSVTRKSLIHTVRGNGSLPVVGAVFWGIGELCKVRKDSCGYLWKTDHLGNCWKTANTGKEEKHSTRCLKSILWSRRRQEAAGFPGQNRDEGFGDVDSCWVKKSDVLVVRQAGQRLSPSVQAKMWLFDLVGNFGKDDLLDAQTPFLPRRELPLSSTPCFYIDLKSKLRSYLIKLGIVSIIKNHS